MTPPKPPKGYVTVKRYGIWVFIKKAFQPERFGKGKRVVK
jgi:hypothetical protein